MPLPPPPSSSHRWSEEEEEAETAFSFPPSGFPRPRPDCSLGRKGVTDHCLGRSLALLWPRRPWTLIAAFTVATMNRSRGGDNDEGAVAAPPAN